MENSGNKNSKKRVIVSIVLILIISVVISYIIALLISSLQNPSTAEIIKDGSNNWVKSGGMKNQFMMFISSWVISFPLVFIILESVYLIIRKHKRKIESIKHKN